MVGTSARALAWWIYNCVTPGIALGGASTAVVRRNNVLTKAGAALADPSEAAADHTAVHRDAAAADWSLKPASVLAGKSGFDVASVVAEWEAIFPGIDFRKDLAGRAWDPKDPGVGPFGKLWAG